MKTTSTYPSLLKAFILFSAACISAFETEANEPPVKNRQEGTLLGAIQNQIKHNKKLNSTRLISGNIRVTQGAIPFPYVMLKESKGIVFVDQNGNFEIEVSGKNPILIVGGSDVMEREFEVGTDDHYDIEIIVEASDDNPYHVNLYGMPINRQRYTGAFNRINEHEIHSRVPINVGTALDGFVPGLHVFHVGVAVHQVSFSIRGRNSIIGSSAPLIILDGAPYSGSLHAINPFDVGDVTVLKDGTGKAAYGMRGGNGIIIITTKGGISK